MDCVFGEIKNVMINGVSYDELFGVDVNLLNREQRREYVNEYILMNENRLRNLELCIEEHERLQRLENERLQHTKPDYYQLSDVYNKIPKIRPEVLIDTICPCGSGDLYLNCKNGCYPAWGEIKE